MAITKYNATQYAETRKNQLIGVTFVYRSTNQKTGAITETGLNFSGEKYVAADKTEMALFRVWKEVLTVFWNARYDAAILQKDNSGISSKLRASTPAEIVVRMADGSAAFTWYAEDSAYSRVGIVPGSRELGMKRNDFKKHIHKAAVASFNALKGKISFTCKDESEAENAEKPASESVETE